MESLYFHYTQSSFFEKMRIVIVSFFVLVSCSIKIFAQENSTVQLPDTILLDEVVKYGDCSKYQAGAKIETINAIQISNVQAGGIDQLLMRYTPIYVKADAGGLSSVHIRGTSSSHSNIMFGGININSLTLGDCNLSNVTSFLFDELHIQYGSSATMNGSGAIGGAIYLDEKHLWTKGTKLAAKYSMGSFGEQSYGLKLHLGNGKWESATKFLKFTSNNNFSFINTATGDVEHKGGIPDVQEGAKIDNFNIIQQINYLFGPNESFKSSFWYADSWHQVQLNMQENHVHKTPKELNDNNFRSWVEYKNGNRNLKYNISAGYVHDKQIYDADMSQKIQTDRGIIDANVWQKLFEKLDYRTGAKFMHVVPDVYSYSDTVIPYEQHLELYFATNYQPVEGLRFSANFRQQFVSNYDVPFTPALGAEYSVLRNSSHHILAKLNVSKHYRVPTLNDRFWGNQGNIDLKPEDGVGLDMGATYRWNDDIGQSLNLQANLFYIDIENWIEWRNKGTWIPVSLGRVISKGIEFHGDAKLKWGRSFSEFLLNYTFNPAEKIETGKPTQQLIYIPMHMANASYSFQYEKFRAFIDGSFTGSRFNNYAASESSRRDDLDPYFLANCGLAYQLSIMEQMFSLSFSANNIFNVDYQNQKYYAMPGINFKLGISAVIDIKRKSKKK